jgi:hypothetical protein
MVRNYKRKSERGKYGDAALSQALQAIRNGMSLHKASTDFGISRPVLRRHRDGKVSNPGKATLGRFEAIFMPEMEQELAIKIQQMEKALFGLTTVDVRRLAFELAERLQLAHNFSKHTRMAGLEWMRGFLRRNPQLSIRTPQGTSISRAVGFNRPKVEQFYKVYKECLNTSTKYTANNIWNVDESGITSVQKPGKIFATKGARQVSKMTSAERGATVTVVCAMSASGQYIPPMMIWPRKRLPDALMRGAPPGAIGTVSDNGWTDSKLFLKWLQHFIDRTKTSKEDPSILILDGHNSHKSLEAVDLARENGITMITLPPHCTHKMQPLDRTFFKSLKANYNRACDNYMTTNIGKRITFYEMADLFGKAYGLSATVEKAAKGFDTTGIWPFDDNKFSDEDFAASAMTDEPSHDVAKTGIVDVVSPGEPQRDVTDVNTETVFEVSAGEPSNDAVNTGTVEGFSCGEPSSDVNAVIIDAASHGESSHDVTSRGESFRDAASHGESSRDVASPGESSKDAASRGESSRDVASEMLQTAASQSNIEHPGLKEARAILAELSPPPKIAKPRSRTHKSEAAENITLSPYKHALAAKEATRSCSGTSKRKLDKSSGKGKAPVKQAKVDTTPCSICAKRYCDPPFEDWQECPRCLKWCHESCSPDDSAYCYNCLN